VLDKVFWTLLGFEVLGVMFLLGATLVEMMIRGDREGAGSMILIFSCAAPMLFLAIMGAVFYYARWATLQWVALAMLILPGLLIFAVRVHNA